MFSILLLSILAAFIAPAFGQTSTSCSPLNATCPPDQAFAMEFNWNMTNTTLDTSQGVWNNTGPGISYSDKFATFTINQKGDAPTIQSNFYIFWGSVSVIMKASSGQGIVSSIVLESDDLDEIDWEWIGGNSTHVQTNYFGKGNTTVYDRAIWVEVDNPQENWHNYTTVWDQNQLQWLIDGQVVRTLPYAQADGNGTFYPQSPMDVRLGSWGGGDSPSPDTVKWAGGAIDYSKAPFNMEVADVYVNDAQRNVSQYTYGDHSGSWQSIKMVTGNSPVRQTILSPPAESVSQKFNELSTGAKIAIFASIGGVLAIGVIVCGFCCIRQRKAGRRERALADAQWDREYTEFNNYKQQMAGGKFGFSSSSIPLSPNPQHGLLENKF